MDKKPSILNYLSPFIMIAIGLWHYARHGMDVLTFIPIALGLFALYLVLLNHLLLQRVLTSLAKLWYPIGQFVSLFLFMVTFYLVFAPVGILLRLFKKDILNRDLKPNSISYWIDRSIKDQNKYTQQF